VFEAGLPERTNKATHQPPKGTSVMNLLNNKYVQMALTIIVVIAVLRIAAPYTQRIPLVGKYLSF
jgi:hypothetical protein